MRLSVQSAACLLALFFCALDHAAIAAQSPHAKEKKSKQEQDKDRTVWNFSGGMVLLTDGAVSPETCFRISGRVTGGGFFAELKRIDDNSGTTYRRGDQVLTEFPDKLLLNFSLYDFPCPGQLRADGPRRTYMSQEMMDSLRLSIYWKHGVDMQSVENPELRAAAVEPIEPYAVSLAESLSPRFVWTYAYEIPSAGIPLTDSLVVIFRSSDKRIAARVAARL
jgi:hypothetical protein